MIPLVTCIEEVQAVKKAIEAAKEQLKENKNALKKILKSAL